MSGALVRLALLGPRGKALTRCSIGRVEFHFIRGFWVTGILNKADAHLRRSEKTFDEFLNMFGFLTCTLEMSDLALKALSL